MAESPYWEEVLKLVALMRNHAFLTFYSGAGGVNRDILQAEARAYDKVYVMLDALNREALGERND
jgi:hypothetical protein